MVNWQDTHIPKLNSRDIMTFFIEQEDTKSAGI